MLPLGMQTFRRVRKSGGFYVDKTGFAAQMTAEGTHYFLSRPRRFGKSVFINTLKELFEGTARRPRQPGHRVQNADATLLADPWPFRIS